MLDLTSASGRARSTGGGGLLWIVAPLLAGSAIYLLWRERSLLMFAWVDAAGLGPGLDAARAATAAAGARLPRWVLYSLPNGLWIFSLNAALLQVWGGGPGLSRGLWLTVALALGAGAELLQLAGLLPGSFDPMDLAVCFVAAALPIALFSFQRRNSPCSSDSCSRPGS